jgi:hypothetical protein
MRDCVTEEIRPIGAMNADDPTARPVAQPRVGARLEHEASVERIIRKKARLNIEIAPERGPRSGPADRDNAAKQNLVVGDPSHLDRTCADMDDNPVSHGVKIDVIASNPAALAIRTARQTELIPPATVDSAPGGDGEDDLKLPVAPETTNRVHKAGA